MKKLISRLNLSQVIACHLIGIEHTSKHRKYIGGVIITIGIIVMEVTAFNPIIHIIGDTVAVSCHAIGFIPFVESILDKKEKSINNESNI